MALHKKYSIRNLRVRLDMLSKLRHPHLVGLLGHCIDGGIQDDNSTIHRLFLVQEFIPNGNYSSHLSGTRIIISCFLLRYQPNLSGWSFILKPEHQCLFFGQLNSMFALILDM